MTRAFRISESLEGLFRLPRPITRAIGPTKCGMYLLASLLAAALLDGYFEHPAGTFLCRPAWFSSPTSRGCKTVFPQPARRVFTREFKQAAVKLVTAGGHPTAWVARNLGVTPNLLRRWKQEVAGDPVTPFSGKGRRKPHEEEPATTAFTMAVEHR